MRVMSADEGWDWLIKKTRRRPFLWFGADVKREDGAMVLRNAPIRRDLRLTFATVASAALALIAIGWGGAMPPRHVLLELVVLLFLTALMFYRSDIRWDPSTETLSLLKGLPGLTRRVDLPAERLRAELRLRREDSDQSPDGYVELRLRRQGRAEEVPLVRAHSKSRLLPAFLALRSFLRGRVTDHTVVQVEVPGGSVPMSRTPVHPPLAGYLPRRVAVRGDRAAVGLSRLWLCLCGLFLLTCGAAFVQAALAAWGFGHPLAVVGCAVMLILMLTAGVPLLALARKNLVADGRRRRLRVRELRLTGSGWRKLEFEKVAGVQVVVSRALGRGEDRDRRYEVNLVLPDLPEGRITLLARRRRTRAAQGAERLSAFLGVPWWDHAVPAAPEDEAAGR